MRYGETTNGTNVQLWTSNNSKAQQWTFTTPRDVLDALAKKHRSDLADGTYVVASALDGGKVLDVSNGSHDNGANVQLWTSNGTTAQKWMMSHDKKGYVTLTNTGSGKPMDVRYGEAHEGTRYSSGIRTVLDPRSGSPYKTDHPTNSSPHSIHPSFWT